MSAYDDPFLTNKAKAKLGRHHDRYVAKEKAKREEAKAKLLLKVKEAERKKREGPHSGSTITNTNTMQTTGVIYDDGVVRVVLDHAMVTTIRG